MRDRETIAVQAILLGFLLLLAACSHGGGGAPDIPKGTPVVLISIDTLRADHLPAYGYKGVETPALDGLRRDGVLFERAYSTTPLTFPSHTTLLTGVLPAVHGVRDNVGYKLDAAKVQRGEMPFLPAILKRAGYATGGAVSAYVLQGKTGLSTGFDFYEDGIEFRTGTGLGGLQRPGSETLRLSRDWLRSVKDKPFFFFFHIYEPHSPYTPPEPYASRYPLKYDGEIATADHIVGDLIDELKALGVYDRAIVVLLSDHGEGLGDHGEEEHGVLLYEEAIHVPLILKLPRAQKAGGTTARPVQLLDVAPTVLGLLRLGVPKPMSGLSLLAERAAPRRIYSETFYPRLHFGWSELFSLIDERTTTSRGPTPSSTTAGRTRGRGPTCCAASGASTPRCARTWSGTTGGSRPRRRWTRRPSRRCTRSATSAPAAAPARGRCPIPRARSARSPTCARGSGDRARSPTRRRPPPSAR